MTPLTPAMRTALEQAAKNPLRRVHDDQPGCPPWPAPAPSLHALVKRELVTVSEIRNKRGWRVTLWTVTDAGKAALNPPPRIVKDTVHHMGGSTTTRVLVGGVWAEIGMPEPEKVRAMPVPEWTFRSRGVHAEAMDPRMAARATRRLATSVQPWDARPGSRAA